MAVEFTRALRPLLQRCGTHPHLHLVLFTLDETVFSRELAPLAGFYPPVYVGAPWWFLDAPDAIRRFRAAVTETLDLVTTRPNEVFRAVTAALSRGAGHGRPAPPVRLVHLGLGNFFRAHQAWYTERAPDAEQWGIAAFEGRGARLAQTLAAQDGLYTLVTRAAGGDRFDVISSVSRAHASDDHDAWLGYLASPEVRAVTVTITEAGYLRGADGGLDRTRDDVQADVATLRRDLTARVLTAPARLVAGLAARRRAEAGPLTLIPCDNLPDNGAVAARVVADLADMVDSRLAEWSAESLSTVTTMVDRITPRTAPEDVVAVSEGTGLRDDAPVVTEPFREWVLSGTFLAGRPRWEDAGATFADDIVPFEHRKLWLLNGGHSLLAYAGAIRGHDTVADAVADEVVRGWLLQWWTRGVPTSESARR